MLLNERPFFFPRTEDLRLCVPPGTLQGLAQQMMMEEGVQPCAIRVCEGGVCWNATERTPRLNQGCGKSKLEAAETA